MKRSKTRRSSISPVHMLRHGALLAAAAVHCVHAAEEPVLEEIVVSAQKRVESIQRVPISVSVVDGDSIARGNFVSLQDLSQSLPAVTAAQSVRNDRLVMRGVGSGDNSSFEQSVGTFVDGVYHGRSLMSRNALFDLERVEVLKGPQSVFLGNNAIAGALNITTRRASDVLEGNVRVLYNSSDNEYAFEGGLGGPLSDTLAARAAIKLDGMDGYLRDRTAGDDVPRQRNRAGRLTFSWEPSATFRAALKVEGGEQENRGGMPYQLVGCPPGAPFTGPRGFCNIAIANDLESRLDDERSLSPGQGSRLKSQEYVLTLEADLAQHVVTSITAYSQFDFWSHSDIDVVPPQLFNVGVVEDYSQFSQELRIVSTGGGAIDYLGGLFYQKGDLSSENQIGYLFLTPVIAGIPAFAALVPTLPFAQSNGFGQDDETVSAFGSFTWHATDSLRTTLGLRWTEVRKDFHGVTYYGTAGLPYGAVTPLPPALAPLAQAFANAFNLGQAGEMPLDGNYEALTPSANVQFDIAPDKMLYASYARGFKAGGFDGANTSGNADSVPFDSEHVNAYEIGLKSQWFGRRLMLNAALFRSEYEDLQLNVPRNQGTAILNEVENVGGLISQGAEVDATLLATPSLQLRLSATVLDAHYTSYPNAGVTAAQSVQGLQQQDLSGETTINAPDLSASLTVRHELPLFADLTLRSELSAFYSDDYLLAADNDPNLRQPAYTRLDARIALAGAGDRWEVALLGRNLTDETIRVFGTDQPTSPGSYVVQKARPRSVALEASFRW